MACYGIGKYDDDDEHNPGSLFIVQELVRGGNLLHKVRGVDSRCRCFEPVMQRVYYPGVGAGREPAAQRAGTGH